MKQRLGYVLVLALASASVGMSACSGDDTSGDEDTGGSAGAAGSHAGTKTGGSSSSGSSNKAGSHSGGGQAGNGSAGTPDEGGAAGGGGVPGGGGAGADGGGVGGVGDGGMGGVGANGNDAGAGGTGGAGEPQLVYACGSDNAYKKVCSAKAAANCDNAIVCAECVPQTKDEHDGAATGCQACDDLIDDYYQCGIDAFETGNTAAGMQCVDGVDADFSDQCFEFFSQYFACDTYLGDHDCPATWPAE